MDLMSAPGLEFLMRWGHYMAGITWIGLLYYFNFVQGAFFAETDAATKNNVTAKLAPRALWWFRWAAVVTFVTGLIIIIAHSVPGMQRTAWATTINTGVILGTIMMLNVWGIIWRKQKIVIASATRVLAGGEADPGAAAAGRRALLASRTNTLFSIPMLLFMGAASHFPFAPAMDTGNMGTWWMVALPIILAIEANAIWGDKGFMSKWLEKHKDTITAGFVLSAVFLALGLCLSGACGTPAA